MKKVKITSEQQKSESKRFRSSIVLHAQDNNLKFLLFHSNKDNSLSSNDSS